MQLPGPLRAAVGLVASAADNAKHLPDRAIEVPMLAVSTALQLSLRAQQRYAHLTARGDEVLSRRRPSDEPPEWATFDEPVPGDESHSRPTRAASATAAAQLLDELLGEPSPTGPAGNDPAPTDEPESGAATAPAAEEAGGEPTKAAAAKSATKSAAKATAKKAAATPATARKATAKQTSAAAKPAARRTNTSRANGGGKGVSKPRHTAPSRFDEVGDTPDDTDGD